jgi:ornithine cyclodeaminase
MMRIVRLEEIKRVLPNLDLMPSIEAGFVAYSQGDAVVPPVGELLFDDPPGDVHIKYGYLKNDSYYVVKIASGFYQNPEQGLSSSNGLMMLFQQRTGLLECILLDEGYLTDVRTALAGAIAARHLAVHPVDRIGILGTGIQARFQLRHLLPVTGCSRAIVWGRSREKLDRYRDDMENEGFSIETTNEVEKVASRCRLIVTTTAATSPLLWSAQVRPGTHITAMGSDTPQKQELDPSLLQKADRVIVDSLTQCSERGEFAHALRAGLLDRSSAHELGKVISGEVPGRSSEAQITISDLTGVAVQDIQIAKAVFESLS